MDEPPMLPSVVVVTGRSTRTPADILAEALGITAGPPSPGSSSVDPPTSVLVVDAERWRSDGGQRHASAAVVLLS